MSNKAQTLHDLIAPAVAALGYEFIGSEYYPQGRHSLLRVYIDSPDGISVDDCAKVSHQISAVFAVNDPIASEYTLEVSSPGLDRPLFSVVQMQQFIGHLVHIKLRTALQGRRNFSGKLLAVNDNGDIDIEVDEKSYKLVFANVDKANLIPEV